MAVYPAAPMPWLDRQFCDANGDPLAGGKLYSYEAGTSTPLALYSDVDLTTPYANPIVLDADGRPPDGPVFLQPQGYKFILTDSDDVQVWSLDDIEDVGQVFAENFGLELSEGGKQVTSGYTVLDTDRLVTVDSTGGADPCLVNLPAAGTRTQPVIVKNLGTVALSVTPNGGDTIEGIASAFTVAAAASPTFPTIWLVSDGVSGWWVLSSHGL